MLRTSALAGAALFAVAAYAQTTTGSQQITTFNAESVIPLTNIYSANQPNLPPELLASLVAGNQQIRQTMTYDPSANTIQVVTFLVDKGAPLPTPAGATPFLILERYTINVSNILQSQTPSSSVVFVGTVGQNNVQGPFGLLTGAPAIISTGYKNATAGTTFSNFVSVISGVVASSASSVSGSLVFQGQNTPPPGGTSPVTVSFVGGNKQSTPQKQYGLDASASTGAANPLTYSWRLVSPSGGASITGGNTATPVVTFGGAGDYVFEVTVTDAKGNTGIGQITVTYSGR